MNSEITRSQLIGLVKNLVDERRTSTLYVHTDDNHLIVVGVDAGEIVSLICGPRQGERAIPMIRKMASGTYRSEEKVTVHSRSGRRLPSSKELLAQLADDSGAEAVDDRRTAPVMSQKDCEWVQNVLCKVLAEYMGPIAPLVCRETVSAAGGLNSPAKLRRVVDDLAAEIDNRGEAESFKAKARDELGSRLRA